MSCNSQETIYLPNIGYITCQNQRTEKYSIVTYFMKSSFKSDLVIVLEYTSSLQIQPKPKSHGPNLTIDLWDLLYGPHVIIGLAIHIWLSGWFFSQSCGSGRCSLLSTAFWLCNLGKYHQLFFKLQVFLDRKGVERWLSRFIYCEKSLIVVILLSF